MPEFRFDFPLCVILDTVASRGQPLPTGLRHAVRLVVDEKKLTVMPIFTERRLAERFIGQRRLSQAEPRVIKDAAELIPLVEVVEDLGYTYAAFNPDDRPEWDDGCLCLLADLRTSLETGVSSADGH